MKAEWFLKNNQNFGVSEFEIIERKEKKNFQKACVECNEVPLDTFIVLYVVTPPKKLFFL